MKVQVNTPITSFIYIIFIILKLTNIINWSWWYVNIPLFIIILVYIGAFIYYKCKYNKYLEMLGMTEEITINI